jgi:hypothetical protein
MTLEKTVIQQGITSDAAYAGYVARDLSDRRYAPFAGVVSLCLVPYLSLFVHESFRKLSISDPALTASLSSDVESIVARSRHSLKLFEDTHCGIDGQLAYFRDEVLPAHANYFLGNTWFLPARRWEKDLGIFTYEKRLITTSHGANFHMGLEPQALLAKTGSELRAIYEEYGRYFAYLGARLDVAEDTFISKLDPQRFNRHPIDVRADKYYHDVFDGASNSYLNALLTVFRGMLNFVDFVITAGQTTGTIEYTVFKIRFLTVYQILGSLHMLRNEKLGDLRPHSVCFIDKIIGTPEAQLIMDRAAKPFRNTLMHYNLNSRVDISRVNPNQPLFGLIPIYFPAHNVNTFAAAVDRCISETASAAEEWADA